MKARACPGSAGRAMIAIACLVLSAACSPREKPTAETAAAPAAAAKPAAGDGLAVLLADAPDALYFVDGRFVGETAEAGTALRLRLPGGRHDLRVSARARFDLFSEFEVRAGSERTFGAVIPGIGDAPTIPDAPVPIGLGQTLRLHFAPRGAPRSVLSAKIAADAPDDVLVIVSDGPKSIVVESDRMAAAPFTEADRTGLDGIAFFAFSHPGGEAVLTIRNPADHPAVLVVRIVRRPPPMLADPKRTGRRSPAR